jgi:hypothetical protein
MRATVVAGAALLAAWLIALALGVLGGFGSLPLLPGSGTKSPSEVSSEAQQPQAPPAVPRRSQANTAKAAAPRSTNVRSTPPTGSRATSAPRAKPTHPAQSTSNTPPAASNGNSYGTTRPSGSGKPLETPGNGPGGTGAPGLLR